MAAQIFLKKRWQQRTPERPRAGVPNLDEVQATLLLLCGDQDSEVRKWAGDLAKNRWLIQAR